MIPCIFNLGTGEIIIILVVILLLFGARRIPELARSMGRGVNSFRQGLNEVSDQIKAADKEDSTDKREDSGK
ncbi:MAG: twin-arginine translocase TatA/TatE family subunit [Duncaniella sp.]|nr:twin-arginine translocase TatA/TatE family subunit [Duncaniella sp.]